MTKLEGVARALNLSPSDDGDFYFQGVHSLKEVIRAYDQEPSAEEIEAAAAALCADQARGDHSWGECPSKRVFRREAKSALLSARLVRLARIEEKQK